MISLSVTELEVHKTHLAIRISVRNETTANRSDKKC